LHDPHGGDLVADAIGLGEVLGFAGGRARRDQGFDLFLVNFAPLTSRDICKINIVRIDPYSFFGNIPFSD